MKLQQFVDSIDHHLWSSEIEVAQFLSSLIRMTKTKKVIEIGVFKGLTSCYIIDAIGHDGDYVGIDIEDHRNERIKELFSFDNVAFNISDSVEYLNGVESNSVDLVFLDGDHTIEYVKREFFSCMRILKDTGTVCLHDANYAGVYELSQFLKKEKHFNVITLETPEKRGLCVINFTEHPYRNISALKRRLFFYSLNKRIKAKFKI